MGASSGCSCDTWWFGADCNHVALPVGGGVASAAHPVTANWLREHPLVAEHAISNLNDLEPLQWHFFSFELCRVTGVVVHTVRLRVPSNAVLPLAAASTQKTDLQTRVLNQSSLDEQGVTYSARTGTAMEDRFASTDPVESDVWDWRFYRVYFELHVSVCVDRGPDRWIIFFIFMRRPTGPLHDSFVRGQATHGALLHEFVSM